ncbi:hypothetical protein [Marinobacter sp.]|uniref:hypothetical protein n=1 Tax=Marinobacter sp. TaxID=50741 RepID=UPI003A920419
MKALTYLLIGILSLSACTSQNATSIDNAGSFLCIPPEYAVFVGETGTSSAEFDSQGGGYNVSIFLNQNTVSQLVPEYKSETNIGGRVRKHALYITLSPSEEINQAVPDAPTKDLLDGEMQLLAVKADTFSWQVIQKTTKNQQHWGTCADLPTEPKSFRCLRDLIIEGLGLTYPISQENLHVYPAIDALLQEKVAQWRCASSGIPIEQQL